MNVWCQNSECRNFFEVDPNLVGKAVYCPLCGDKVPFVAALVATEQSAKWKTKNVLLTIGVAVVVIAFLLMVAAESSKDFARRIQHNPVAMVTMGIVTAIAFVGLGLALLLFIYGLIKKIWELALLPGKIAAKRVHPATDAILLCGIFGLFFGLIFWVVALIWAHSVPERQASR